MCEGTMASESSAAGSRSASGSVSVHCSREVLEGVSSEGDASTHSSSETMCLMLLERVSKLVEYTVLSTRSEMMQSLHIQTHVVLRHPLTGCRGRADMLATRSFVMGSNEYVTFVSMIGCQSTSSSSGSGAGTGMSWLHSTMLALRPTYVLQHLTSQQESTGASYLSRM